MESSGIATTLIALFRLHAEKMRPPRALWVPFELGRPIGSPGHPVFQRRVVEAALSLLDAPSGPVLENFPDPDPGRLDDPGWQCPVMLDAPTLEEEIAQLAPQYRRVVEASGRTTVGVSGLDFEDAGRMLARFGGPDPIDNPRRDLHEVQMIRFAIDDVKAAYLETAAAGSGRPSSRQLVDWFWQHTRAAEQILSVRRFCFEHTDASWRMAKSWLVPETQLEMMRLPPSFG